MENNNGGNKFLNGFLLGALIGGGIVLLLNSKKGKKLLKILSEEGLDNISNFLQEQENNIEDNFEEDEAESANGESENNAVKEEKKPFVRRFFRGIPKRH